MAASPGHRARRPERPLVENTGAGPCADQALHWLPGHKAAETQSCQSDPVRVLARLSSHNAHLNHFLLPLQTCLTWLQIQRWFPDGPHTLTHGTPWRTRGSGHTGEGLPSGAIPSVAGGDPETRRGQMPWARCQAPISLRAANRHHLDNCYLLTRLLTWCLRLIQFANLFG